MGKGTYCQMWLVEIFNIMYKYYEQLYVNIFEILDEMDNFLEDCK